MSKISIRGNGDIPLTAEGYTPESKTTVHAPTDIGSASIAVGWLDNKGAFNEYLDGALIAGQSSLFNTGTGVNLVARIVSFSTPFIIHAADTRSR